MVNINLSTSGEGQKNNIFPAKKIICLVVVVVIWLGAYAAAFSYKVILDKKIEKITNEQSLKENSIKEGKNKNVFDFQTRLTLANSLIEKKSDVFESLNKIQEVMISEVNLLSYEYNKKDGLLILICKTNNYNSVARQILNFKKSEYFSSIKIVNIEKDAEAGITFSIETKINQAVK